MSALTIGMKLLKKIILLMIVLTTPFVLLINKYINRIMEYKCCNEVKDTISKYTTVHTKCPSRRMASRHPASKLQGSKLNLLLLHHENSTIRLPNGALVKPFNPYKKYQCCYNLKRLVTAIEKKGGGRIEY